MNRKIYFCRLPAIAVFVFVFAVCLVGVAQSDPTAQAPQPPPPAAPTPPSPAATDASPQAAPQTTPTVSAVAVDRQITGAVRSGSTPLPGVAVSAANTLTGKKVFTSTDLDGTFMLLLQSNGR